LSFSIPRSAIVGKFQRFPLIKGITIDMTHVDCLRLGVIGANGTGKTTLFRIITGELKPDSGTIHLGASVSSFIHSLTLSLSHFCMMPLVYSFFTFG
jgi:ABC-type polysaccharide/polyol phosphate transport system ATPase subunit